MPQGKGPNKTAEFIHHHQHASGAVVARWEFAEVGVHQLPNLLDLVQANRVGKLSQVRLLAGWSARGARVSTKDATMGEVFGEHALD